jgi:hypothetical protein
MARKREQRHTLEALEPVFRPVYISMAKMYNYHFEDSQLPELPESGTGINEDMITNLDDACRMLREESQRSVETKILRICIEALRGLILCQPGIPNMLLRTLSIARQLSVRELIILLDRYDAAIGQRPVYMFHPSNDDMDHPINDGMGLDHPINDHMDHPTNDLMDHSINDNMDED